MPLNQTNQPSGKRRLQFKFHQKLIFFLSPVHPILDIGIMVNVFANGPGDLNSISGRVIPKTQKRVLDALYLTLSIIRHGSRVSEAILRKEWRPPLHLYLYLHPYSVLL